MMIRPRSTSLLSLACGLLLLLPSCVRWNIGRNIRESTETWVGVNLAECLQRPDGMDAADWPRGTAKSWHYLAPEVRYQPDYPLVGLVPGSSSIPRARHIEPTGHLRMVTSHLTIIQPERVSIGEKLVVQAAYPGPQQPAPPRVLRLHPVPHVNLSPNYPVRPLRPREMTRSAWYWPAAVAAAPFDYLIDPALSLISTPVVWLGAGAVNLYTAITSSSDTP